MRFSIILLVFTLLACKPASNQAVLPSEFQFENQIGYVNDFTDILTIEQENKLEKIFSDYDLISTNELGVLTIDSIAPFTDINKFGAAVLEDWRFGKDDKFNGLLIIISPKERQASIRFGSGIQKYISDKEAKIIIDQVLIPEFKNENYYGGVVNAVKVIKQKLDKKIDEL